MSTLAFLHNYGLQAVLKRFQPACSITLVKPPAVFIVIIAQTLLFLLWSRGHLVVVWNSKSHLYYQPSIWASVANRCYIWVVDVYTGEKGYKQDDCGE
jgi:hypothetical protein